MPDGLILKRAPAPLDAPYPFVLIPSNGETADRLVRLPLGEDAEYRLVKSRSNLQNRLWHALLGYVAEGAGYSSGEALGQFVKVALGYYDIVHAPTGKALAVPKSTAFDAMPHDEFCSFMDRGVALICRDVLGGMLPDDLITEVCTTTGLPMPPAKSESQKHIVAEQDQLQSAAVRRADGTQTASPPAAPSDQNGATVAQSSGQTSGADQGRRGVPWRCPSTG